MRYGAVLLLYATTALAQQVTTADKLPAPVKGFDDRQGYEPFPCSVQPVKPTMNFGFRFQTGYTVETSLDPYLGGRHHWYIVFRVTPQDNAGPPVYFLDSIDLPAPRQTGFLAVNTGAFQTGEGRYDVRWGLLDDLGRFCRQEWTVDAHLTAAERSEKVAMPPDTAGDFSWRPRATANGATKFRQVTILLNATMPARPVTRGGLPVDQWGMLVSMLASLVEQMPGTSVRVVAFDTAQQRELFRKDDFTPADINDVAHVANARQRWAIDYQALQNPSGGWDLLRDLENKEMHATAPSETVIFLGVPQARFDKMPPGMPGPEPAPRFFYLKYGPTPTMAQALQSMDVGGRGLDGGRSMGVPRLNPPGAADQPDLIEQSVRRLNGKIFTISTPADFSKALTTIER
jgi:hypothetical protein